MQTSEFGNSYFHLIRLCRLRRLLQLKNYTLQMMLAMLEAVGHSPTLDSSSTLVNIINPKSLNDFPDEILLKILSHLEPEDLVVTSKVCERWFVLAKDVTLWKYLTYRCDHFSEFSFVVEVLTWAPVLHSLIMYNRKDAAQLLELLFLSCDSVKKLILRYCSLGEDSTGVLASIVACYPELEELSLEGCCPLTFAGSGYAVISRLENLSGLNLSHCKGLTGKSVQSIVQSCRHLTRLSLDDVTQIFDDDVMYVIRILGKQLTTLVLDGEDLTDKSFCYLQHCSRLQVLEISFCDQMTDKGLLNGIGPLLELNTLRLKRGHNLSSSALASFLNRPEMSHIVYLNLSECSSLDDHGLESIANRCPHLRNLSVCWCWELTDDGIMVLVNKCRELEDLDLLGVVRVTGTGYFALIPSHLPHLKRLNLEQCNNICDESLMELVAALPNLEVIDYYGERVKLNKETTDVQTDYDDD